MGINKKLSLGIFLTLAMVIVLLFFLLDPITSRGFAAIERLDADTNIVRVEQAFAANIDTLAGILTGWYQWDEPYAFLSGKADDFIEKNVSSITFQNLRIRYLFFIDRANTIRYQGGYDAEGRPLQIPAEIRAWVDPNSPLLRHTDNNDVKKGIFIGPESPMIVISAPVIDSAASAPYAGTLVAMRRFDESEVKFLAEVTQLKVTFRADGPLPSGPAVRVTNADFLSAETLFPAMGGGHPLVATIEIPRAVFRQQRRTVHFLIFALAAVGLLLLGVTVVIVRRLVTLRVTRLGLEIGRVRDTLDFSRPISLQGGDELGSLARILNGIIAHVDEILRKYSS